jgi:murein DD-endopeptidase MepM/ murein hydrolase activator NlpD
LKEKSIHSQNRNLLMVSPDKQQVKATSYDSLSLLSFQTTRKTFPSATMLGLALSVGTAGCGFFYQTQQANATTNTITPPHSLLPSPLKLEENSLSERQLIEPTSTENTATSAMGDLPNQNQFQAVNGASTSDLQQQTMLQNLQAKREQLNINLGKLKAKNFPISYTTVERLSAKTYTSLAIEATPTKAIPQLPALTASSTMPDNERQVYQVQAGDTVEIIARRYNTTRERLIEINQLENPNLIFVAQQLTIPSSELSKNWNNDNTSLIFSSQLLEKTLSPLPATNVSFAPSTTLPREEQTTAVSQPLGKVDSWLESATELYTTKLRAEIVELREQYQNQIKDSRDNEQISSSSITENVKFQLPTLPELPNLTSSKQASLSTKLDSNHLLVANADSSKSQDSLVSTAPSSIENYNQMFRIPVGESVTPELPPLSSPDQYLPSGSSSEFDGYIWPSVGIMTSGYGWRWGRMHRGIDIAGPIGTPIVAAASGEVVFAGWSSGGYGNLVKIEHGDGSITLYAHNNKILVRRGQLVEQGEQIAEMGSTGYSTGPHLHFEIRPDGQTTANPIAFLPTNESN